MSGSRKVVIAVVVLAILGAAVASEILRAERGIEVRHAIVEAREVVSTITATGQIRARRQVNISSDVMGRVTRLTVDEGDQVSQGDILLEVDPSQIRAAVARARATLSQAEAQVAQQRANLRQAEVDLGRLEEMAATDQGLISAQQLEEARTRLEVQASLVRSALYGAEQAEAGLEEAEDQFARTTIRAPISGTVIRLNIEEGETAVVGTMNNPGSLLLTIGDLEGIEAVMAVDETDVPMIARGDSAVVELDAFPDKRFAAQVTSIGNSSIQAQAGGQASNVEYEVILALLNPPAELRPDLSATADIVVDRVVSAVTVPIIAVTVRAPSDAPPVLAGEDDEGEAVRGPVARSMEVRAVEGVFVIRDGRAVWTPVVLGVTGQEHFEVLDGVAVGDTVVSGPYQVIQDLEDGAEVRLIDASR